MKIGIVGTGDVASGNYLPFLCKQDGVVLGLYNRSQDKSEAAASRFGGTAFSSLDALADWKPHTVLVLTNETTRYDVVSELLHRGVPRLLCEKPLVAAQGQAHVTEKDFEQGRELLRTAAQNGCQMAMMFNYRFFEQSLRARRIVAERNFGEVIHIMAQVHYACWSHCLDLIRHFVGEYLEVSALAGPVRREAQGIAAPDAVVAFRMQNGATGTLIGTAGMKWQHPLYELHLTFERGRIHLRGLDGEMEILDGAMTVQERVAIGRDASRWNSYAASFEKALTAYLQSLRDGTEPPVTGMDGLKELQVEAAIKRSVAEHRPVQVPVEFPLE